MSQLTYILKSLGLYFFVLFFALPSIAARLFTSVPAGTLIVAGDNVCTNPPWSTIGATCLSAVQCISADVNGSGVLGSGVRAVSNNYYLQLNNVSNVDQTVTVTFEPTANDYFVSSTINSGIPDKAVAVPLLPRKVYNTFLLKKAGDPADHKGISYMIFCNNGNRCEGKLDYELVPANDTTTTPPSFNAGRNSAGGLNTPFVCQQMVSTVRVKISVAEDRGAIQGILAVVPGRSFGVKDKGESLHILLNGGRAF